MGGHLLVLTTLESEDDATRLVRALLERRLVACGTILPGATSLYRWQGAVNEAREVVVLLKTQRVRWDALEAAVRELHPYDVPELIAIPVDAGLVAYLEWVNAETSWVET